MEESSLNSHNPIVPILKIPEVHSFSFAKKCNGEDMNTTDSHETTEKGTSVEDPNAIESIPIENDEEFE